jgi:hemolysin D
MNKTFQKGDWIFREGETGGYAYVLVSGDVEIVKSTAQGERVLVTVEKGALFGEMAIIDQGLRSAGARAASPVEVTEVDSQAFVNYISKNPSMAFNLMRRLSTNLRETNRQLTDLIAVNSASAAQSSDATSANDSAAGVQALKPANRFDDVAYDTDAIYDAPPARSALLAASSILGIILFAIIFSSLFQIDTTVSARGKFSTSVPNIEVQATSNTVIAELKVRRGDRVEKDQILARLDPSVVSANLTITQAKLQAAQQRLLRNENEKALLQSGAALGSVRSDLEAESLGILAERLSEYRSRMATFETRLSKVIQDIESTTRLVEINREQVGLKEQMLAAREELFGKKVVSRIQFLQAKDDLLAVEKVLSEAESRLASQRSEEQSVISEQKAFSSNWFSELSRAISDDRVQVIQLQEEERKLARQQSDLAIRAPVDSVVLDVPSIAVGSLVREGELIIRLVPRDVPLVLEVDIDPKDISDLKLGALVSVKLDALPFQKFGDLEGELVFISEDTFPETLLGEKRPVYRGRVDIQAESMASVVTKGGLTPGMLANADLRVGKRRLISYFTTPILRGMGTAFSEPD